MFCYGSRVPRAQTAAKETTENPSPRSFCSRMDRDGSICGGSRFIPLAKRGYWSLLLVPELDDEFASTVIPVCCVSCLEHRILRAVNSHYYPTALRRVQIAPKSTNMTGLFAVDQSVRWIYRANSVPLGILLSRIPRK